jgi:hypothetical protein
MPSALPWPCRRARIEIELAGNEFRAFVIFVAGVTGIE